ncbi:MAG: DUF5106 domain-containing protein [Bacteroidales bacterium]|jgi:hypothetical protein|nr:DUF5106 domain-containing protein [Bacteroidales bacterium]
MKKNSFIVAFFLMCMSLNAQPVPFRPFDQMSDVVRSEFLAEHYWDGFPFHDTTILYTDQFRGQKDIFGDFDIYSGAIARYLQVIRFADLPTIQRSLVETIKKTDTNERMWRQFVNSFDFFLNDANSRLREEQWIVPVWQQMLKSQWATFSDSTKINFFLRMAAKNPVGSVATDLEFVTIQGQEGRLSEIEAELLLVYFYIPGCADCVRTLEFITMDTAYQELIEAGILQGFAFYPGEDLNTFRSYRHTIPSSWINARNPDGMSQLDELGLYQMRGAPTMYLLDRDKRIILKDARLDLLFEQFDKAREKHLR